jgi:hypothetical protein
VHEVIAKLRADPNLPKLDEAPLRALLQDKMPVIDLSPIGRSRLVGALRNKFGDSYKNFEAAHDALKHFDDSLDHMRKYLKLKGVVRG